ncbi:MAG TPA: MBL fold metallo-hydrolase [Pirellulales bacterium]|nr:MBL fold metallo-hydrolase [Pirellulales bacterium]
MKLHLLGTAGYHPTEHRHTACLMLPEQGIVLDAGTAMFRVRKHLATPQLDIYLTHAHLDHVTGLTYLFDVLADKPMERVTIHALPDKLAAIDQHLLNEQIFPVKLPYEMRPLVQDAPLTDGGTLRYFPLSHPGGSIGLRLNWPEHSLAYVTDTNTPGACASYIDAIRGVDVLVHECYYPDGLEKTAQLTGHSCATPVAQAAKAARVGRLLLTHLNPLREEEDPIGLRKILDIFPEAEIARDGMEVEF